MHYWVLSLLLPLYQLRRSLKGSSPAVLTVQQHLPVLFRAKNPNHFSQQALVDKKRLDIPNAVRAVANANGANAISIFVPCHRVIGSDRSLTGYGGGLTAKKYLLELESIATVGIFASSL